MRQTGHLIHDIRKVYLPVKGAHEIGFENLPCVGSMVGARLQWPVTLPMIQSPREILASFERGEIEREEMQAMMSFHARELIAEMEEDYQNPAAAWIESLLARRSARRLVRRHSARLLREVLTALGEVPDFPPVRSLWNASHPDVPLHCFLRIRREPVFRVLSIEPKGGEFVVLIEHGEAARGKGTRRSFLLRRDSAWKLKATML